MARRWPAVLVCLLLVLAVGVLATDDPYARLPMRQVSSGNAPPWPSAAEGRRCVPPRPC